MTYSFTQVSQYLGCARRYRHRYLDGWQEKDTRAAMLFGRAFKQALAAYFRKEDAAVTFYREWATYKNQPIHYSERDSWDSMLQQGIQLLERFCQEDRVRIPHPRKNLQIKFVRPLPNGNEFIAYVDALGKLDGVGCLLEWKTTSSRYPDQPDGLLALDPQLLCYSWITGISEVAQVVFVRKRLVEIQYFRTKSLTSGGASSVLSSTKPFGKSNQHSFCRTAAFVFRKTPAAHAPTWACAFKNRS